jgi:hypothetical protein
MIPSRIVAQEAIAILTTPLLAHFLQEIKTCDETWSHALVERLQSLCDGLTPHLWDIRLNLSEAPAAREGLMYGRHFTLGDILRDATNRERSLPAIPLLIDRNDKLFLLPDPDFALQAGDHLLVASSLATRRKLELTLKNANELDYVLDGRSDSGSWLWGKLQPLFSRAETVDR